MLNLGRGKEAPLSSQPWQGLLTLASESLQILDPEHGEQELVKSVAAALAKVTALIAENSQRK